MLFFAFAFAVIADPVSSVAYAIEAALRALHGDLALLLPTMSLVIGLVVVVTANYWQLVRRFPKGGGAAAAAAQAFGSRWTFLPIGALVVDFVLTIGISTSAAASAVIALFPGLAPVRIPLALLLLLVVAGRGELVPCSHQRLVRCAMQQKPFETLASRPPRCSAPVYWTLLPLSRSHLLSAMRRRPGGCAATTSWRGWPRHWLCPARPGELDAHRRRHCRHRPREVSRRPRAARS
ncbi:hypothetical protein [Streptomyces sp. NPDC014806]|uniref:hypothetical protein n=1 Tax=Streptomyces sp. NPDC014806 TaxID=3364920 RepID=UPI0036FD5386